MRSHATKLQSGDTFRERAGWKVLPCACHTKYLWRVRRVIGEWLLR